MAFIRDRMATTAVTLIRPLHAPDAVVALVRWDQIPSKPSSSVRGAIDAVNRQDGRNGMVHGKTNRAPSVAGNGSAR